jgi:hypothetical protein
MNAGSNIPQNVVNSVAQTAGVAKMQHDVNSVNMVELVELETAMEVGAPIADLISILRKMQTSQTLTVGWKQWR